MRLIFKYQPGKFFMTKRIKGVIPIEDNIGRINPEKYNILSIKPPDSIADLLNIKSKKYVDMNSISDDQLEFNDSLLFYIAYENENTIIPCKFVGIHYFDYKLTNNGCISRFIEYEPSESEILYKHMTGEFVTQEIAEKMFFEAAPFLFLDKNKYWKEMKKILNR